MLPSLYVFGYAPDSGGGFGKGTALTTIRRMPKVPAAQPVLHKRESKVSYNVNNDYGLDSMSAEPTSMWSVPQQFSR